MTTQTDTPGGEAVLKQMLDGLEGVSEGPWDHDETPSETDKGYYSSSKLMDSEGRTFADAINADATDLELDCPGDNLGEGQYVDELAYANFDHLARCSPDNIRAIAEYVKKLEGEREALKDNVTTKHLELVTAGEIIPHLTAERDAALARVRELEDALDKIASHWVLDNPLWWQQAARDALTKDKAKTEKLINCTYCFGSGQVNCQCAGPSNGNECWCGNEKRTCPDCDGKGQRKETQV